MSQKKSKYRIVYHAGLDCYWIEKKWWLWWDEVEDSATTTLHDAERNLRLMESKGTLKTIYK